MAKVLTERECIAAGGHCFESVPIQTMTTTMPQRICRHCRKTQTQGTDGHWRDY